MRWEGEGGFGEGGGRGMRGVEGTYIGAVTYHI